MSSILRWASLWMRVALLAVLGACSTGWFHVGNDFDLDAFTSHVDRGVTTRDQVRGWLGAPTSTGIDVDTTGQHFDEWTYYFVEGKVSDLSGASMKSLQVKFDSKGIVQGYEFSHAAR